MVDGGGAAAHLHEVQLSHDIIKSSYLFHNK